jgi:hypothetical protein
MDFFTKHKSESESESESDIELSNDLNEDRDVLKKGRQPIGLSRNYVRDWNARDAFREFYQNWSVISGILDFSGNY